MQWFPPLVGLSRTAVLRAASLCSVNAIMAGAVLSFVPGCSAIPAMQAAPVNVAMRDGVSGSDSYSDAEKLRRSQLSSVPDFDTPATSEKSLTTHKTHKEDNSAKPVADATNSRSENSNKAQTAVSPRMPSSPVAAAPTVGAAAAPVTAAPVTAAPVTAAPVTAAPVTAAPAPVARVPVAGVPALASRAAATPSPGNRDSASKASPIAGAGRKDTAISKAPSDTEVPLLRVDAPKPFAWKQMGQSSGSRPFKSVTIGDEGFQSLVIGSVAGHDPLAIDLVEQLARELHDSKTILGGFQSTVIRTLNPDGEALRKILNEKGEYINHGFPKDNGIAAGNQPLEVTFLLEQLQSLKPQRLVHVRTIDGARGVIATSSGSMSVAREVADWLGFRIITLPDTAVSGSLERHLASTGRCDVVTFAIPASTKKEELWDRYGDSLQNLLKGADTTARGLVNQKPAPSSASIRNSNEK